MHATGTNSTGSKSSPTIVSISEIPTITSAAPVADPGISWNKGLIKQQRKKSTAVAILDNPVLLPDSIPAADSAKQLTVEMPKTDQA